MGAIIAGLAVAAVGAGVSAYGTSQNASATREAAKFNAYLENKFGKKWTANAEQFEEDKLNKLYDVGNIFDRFESTGAFGDTQTLENLRTAQEDFSTLAAGDYTGFEGQLRQAMLDNLVSSVGSGAPVGAYQELSANTLLNLRREGLAQAQGVTGFLSGLSNELLGMEFGVMDQGFNQKYMIDRARLDRVTGYSSQAAQTAGVGTSAAGQAISQIGGAISGYGMFQQNQAMLGSGGNVSLGGHSAGGQLAYGSYYGGFGSTSSMPYQAPTIPNVPSYSVQTPRSVPITPTNNSIYGNIPPPPSEGVLPAYYGPGNAGVDYYNANPSSPLSPFIMAAGVGYDIVNRR